MRQVNRTIWAENHDKNWSLDERKRRWEDVKMGATEIECLFTHWYELEHVGSSGVHFSQGNEFRAS
jgi:hypothetical protein